MSDLPTPPTDSDFRDAARELLGWKRPLLISHERPDGDALGCLIAMHSLLHARGVDATAALFDEVPRRYAFMQGVFELEGPLNADSELLRRADGVLVMDTCAFSQLMPIADWLEKTSIPIIALDHHITRDLPARIFLCDADASAASLLVARWANAMGWELNHAAMVAIFVGIATDTGWFRYSNTTPECMRIAADLLEGGVDGDALHKQLYLADPPSMLKGRAVAMGTLELQQNDTIAMMPVAQELLQSSGVTPADLEDVVNAPLSTASIEVSVLLVEMDGGIVKCSFRSKGKVDVATVAASFGGGGHYRAAGARISGSLADVKAAVIRAIAVQSLS